jgi:hypothetical protein
MGRDTLANVARRGVIFCLITVASCNYDWTYRPPSDAGTESGSGIESGAPLTCTLDEPCPPGQFCRFEDRVCGLGKATKVGQCLVAGIKCGGSLFCSCDRTTVLTDCDAQNKGFDVNESMPDSCTTAFACVDKTCTPKAEACVVKNATPTEGNCVACTACPCPGYENVCSCDDSNPAELRVNCK